LKASRVEIGWNGDDSDYIHFVMGHMANEVSPI